jgi:hypothetical protein
MGETTPPAAGRKERSWVLLAGLAALLPDPAAIIPGRSYFFRDFSVTFYPLRLFFARELREGRVPFWNPYIYEGAFALPTFYPLDLLHALDPGPALVSWLLTLHLPLAAAGAYALARELGAEARGAFVAGSAYALGGLALSSLNLYVFLQALALAPFLALSLRRAAGRGGRWIAAAAVVLAASVSTLAVEFVGQALVLGVALALAATPTRDGVRRSAAAVALGLGLAAVPIAVTLGLLAETPRGAGFSRDVALANEVHPLALLQSLVPNLFGSLADPVTAWWGGAFFSKGLPYFLSLYLGPIVLSLAFVGLGGVPRRERRVLLAGAVLGLWYSLGLRGGLALALSYLPGSGAFRFPSKALFLPHVAMALLAGLGATRLRAGSGWPALRNAAAGLGGALVALLLALGVGGESLMRWAGLDPARFPAVVGAVAFSVATSAALALVAVALASLAERRKIDGRRAVILIAVLVVFDLTRAGAGMNPQVSPAFYAPLPELAAQRLDALEGGRVFSYGLDHSPQFRRLLAAGGQKLALASFFVNRQLLAPYNNILDRAEAAEATDLTSFVPRPRELGPSDYDPAAPGALLPWLRNAAVVRVLSLDPLDHPDLKLLTTVSVTREAPVRVYAVERPWAPAYLACRVVAAARVEEALALPYGAGFDPTRDVALEAAGTADCREGGVTREAWHPGLERYRSQADGVGYLVSRASFARGWRAFVDGRPAPVLRANGKNKAVAVPAGSHEVVLRYESPGLRGGVIVTGAFVLVLIAALLRRPGGSTAAPRG